MNLPCASLYVVIDCVVFPDPEPNPNANAFEVANANANINAKTLVPATKRRWLDISKLSTFRIIPTLCNCHATPIIYSAWICPFLPQLATYISAVDIICHSVIIFLMFDKNHILLIKITANLITILFCLGHTSSTILSHNVSSS